MNLDQRIEEHEPIDLKQAIEIADRYLARAGEKVKNDNEALAATMFGFSKSGTDFIEICVNGAAHISYKFEFSNPQAPWFQKFWKGTFQSEVELSSRDQLAQKITEFFSHSSQQILERSKGKSKRSSRSPLGNKPTAGLGIRVFTIVLFSILGLIMAYSVPRGIYDGKIYWSGKYSSGFWVYRDQSPKTFWIWVVIYFAISIWMIRGSILESKIVRRMLKERKQKEAMPPRN